MRNIFKFCAFALITGIIFNSCQKDTFTEEDAMNALQQVNLVVSVVDNSNYSQPVDSAMVSTIVDGVRVDKITDATGTVTFEKVKIGGDVNVYVSKSNYTTSYTTINTTPSDYRQATVSGTVSIYSLSDASLATVKGQLTIETDLTNRTKEVVAGSEVIVYNNNLPNGSSKAFVGITDDEGKYEVKVPVNSSGNDNITVEYKSIETARKAGVTKNNIYSVETQNALYNTSSYNADSIPAVPSALITIGAPEALGTGFELTTEVDTSSSQLSASASNWFIANPGTGYFPNILGADTTFYVFFSPDTKGLDTARIQLTFEKNGGLKTVGGVTDYGTWDGRSAQYSSKPTINLNIGGGTGALLTFDFKLNYFVKIGNSGTGYITLPTVKKTYMSSGVKSVDTYSLSSYVKLVDGSIYRKTNDILNTEGRYDTAPTFTIVNDESTQAFAYFEITNVNADSTLGAPTLITAGGNYNPANPPSVTITGLAGYGSAAEFAAEVNTSGIITNLELINSGKGFVKNVNDFKNNNAIANQGGEDVSVGTTVFNNVLPGKTYISNIYYGTGQVTEIN